MRRAGIPLLVLALTLGWAPAASAQRDGIFFDDPDSPSGKEYALPLEGGRSQGKGPGQESDPGQAGAGESGRFGIGIRSGRRDGGAGAGGERPGGSRRGPGGRGGDAPGEDGSGGPGLGVPGGAGAEPGSTPTAAETGGSPELPLAGAVAAVLLAGGLLGLLVRRLGKSRAS